MTDEELLSEMQRLCRLPSFGGRRGRLARRPPKLTVRTLAHPVRAAGMALLPQHRIIVNTWDGLGDHLILATLAHELVHVAGHGFEQSIPPEGVTFAKVEGGWMHTCGVTLAGDTLCWGRDEDGESTVPSTTFTDVSAGFGFTCGIEGSGLVTQCWGDAP